MEIFVNKFVEYAEIVFYIMFVSILMVITAVPIFTIGAAVTSAYKIFLNLASYDNSMSLKDITKMYFRCFIKKLLPTSVTTIWFVIMIYSCFRMLSLVKMNSIIMAIIFFLIFEVILLFQIIFIIHAEVERVIYFEAIISSFLVVHKFLFYVIAMVLIQIVLMGLIFIFPWTLILMPGLSLFTNTIIFKSKIKPKSLQVFI
jgi:hypothetical protein